MMSLQQLADWYTRKWMVYSGVYSAKPATEESVAYIESKLKVKLPRDFIEFSRLCESYGAWFGSIGDDYDSHIHLLQLNEAFHRASNESFALPENWVLINHGHDGDCDSFDISAGSASEYPVYYINVDSPWEPLLRANTFHEYPLKM